MQLFNEFIKPFGQFDHLGILLSFEIIDLILKIDLIQYQANI